MGGRAVRVLGMQMLLSCVVLLSVLLVVRRFVRCSAGSRGFLQMVGWFRWFWWLLHLANGALVCVVLLALLVMTPILVRATSSW